MNPLVCHNCDGSSICFPLCRATGEVNITHRPSEVNCERCLVLMGERPRTNPAPAAGTSAPSAGSGTSTPAPAQGGTSAVDRPAHYTAGSLECIDTIDALVGSLKDPVSGFYCAQVLKYVWRHERKGKPVEDLEKAQWYLSRLIKRLKKTDGR